MDAITKLLMMRILYQKLNGNSTELLELGLKKNLLKLDTVINKCKKLSEEYPYFKLKGTTFETIGNDLKRLKNKYLDMGGPLWTKYSAEGYYPRNCPNKFKSYSKNKQLN